MASLTMPLTSFNLSLVHLALVFTVATATHADAQTAGTQPVPEQPAPPRTPPTDERPVSGAVFGEAPAREGSRHFLDVVVSAAESYDDNVLADRLPQGQVPATRGLSYPTGTATLSYRGRLKRATLSVGATNAVRYYPDLPQRSDHNHGIAASLEVPWSRWTTLRAEQSWSYATFYTLDGVPGVSLPGGGAEQPIPGEGLLLPNAGFGVSSAGSDSRQSSVALSRQVGRRGSMEARYGIAWNDFPIGRTRAQQAGFRYVHNYTRDVGLRTGYAFQSVAGIDGAPVFHTVDVGLNLTRSLSRSRRTLFLLQTGSAFITRPVRDVQLTADAQLVQLSGRTWTTSLQYLRGTNWVGALAALLSSNTVQATTNGFITRALEATVSGRYSASQFGAGTAGRLHTYAAAAELQYGLTRWLALDAGYFYYFYDSAAALPALGQARELERQGLRAGVSFFLPLVR